MFVFLRFSLLLCLLACILISEAKKCPPSDDIYPCYCSEPNQISDNKIATVYCQSIENLHTLRNVVFNSGDYPFPIWELAGLHFNYVPASALKLKSIQQLTISQSTFVGLFDQVPDVNRKLNLIYVAHSKILRGVEWELFRNIQNLTEIFFNHVSMRSLGKEFKENVQPSLVALKLLETNISKLDDEVFSKLINMKELAVVGGKITILKRSMFPKVNVILHMSFSGNLIENLPVDIFNDMSQLKTVDMGHNRLTTLPETIFGNFKERNTDLNIYGNKIKCDCSIRWIVQKGWNPDGNCAEPNEMKDKLVSSVGGYLDYCDDV